ncbi:hypothetical protein [Halovivax gelatinilyticus]|uniref:hypothetical protein n=1 Tax=Halovivax gelatinilyticus TaxID=2961597 RepID=UPI0020CA8B5B|nr:hypothetical protein [Halovivax gelatinilyticus]
MNQPAIAALHRACSRVGPGRLPGADSEAIGAGYAAASAAAFVAVAYATLATAVSGVGLVAAPYASVAVAALAFPIVVPAAFAIGLVGWRLLAPKSPICAGALGLLGVGATYVAMFVVIGVPITALEALSGADPLRAAVFSWGVVYFAVLETWWVAIPVGAVSGYIYASVVSLAA